MVVTIDNNNHEYVIPSYKLFPLYSPRLKAMISIGSFVILKGNNNIHNSLKNKEGNLVARVNSHDKSNETIYCGIYIPLSNVLHATDDTGSRVDTITTGLSAGILEVVRSTNNVQANSDDIEDICFVFEVSDVENGTAHGLGISNTYICRYHVEHNQSVLRNVDNHLKFASLHKDHIYFE